MNCDIPNVKNDSRYTITETCEKLGIHRNTLRNWVKIGKIKFIVRKVDNRMMFRGFDILKCWNGIY